MVAMMRRGWRAAKTKIRPRMRMTTTTFLGVCSSSLYSSPSECLLRVALSCLCVVPSASVSAHWGEGSDVRISSACRQDRLTVAEREKLVREEEEAAERARQKAEERKVESKMMVIEQLQKEEEQKAAGGSEDQNMPDDNDDREEDAEMELEAWKVRELRRIRREQVERAQLEEDKAETERRSKMTDEQLAQLHAEAAAKADADKGKYKFLQKYYHKGAFYLVRSPVASLSYFLTSLSPSSLPSSSPPALPAFFAFLCPPSFLTFQFVAVCAMCSWNRMRTTRCSSVTSPRLRDWMLRWID